MVAVVIMAETLLSENNFAFRNGYKIRDNQEILACAVGKYMHRQLLDAVRSMEVFPERPCNDQYGGRTQMVPLWQVLL